MATEKKDTQKIKLSKNHDDLGELTQPIKVDDTQSLKVKKPMLWRVILTGLLLTLLLGVAGGALGYRQGIADRLALQQEDLISEAALQYQYGLQQMTNGNYELARTHLEYVLKIYPEFPNLAEKYTEVMVKIAQSGQPSAAPAATATVARDTSNIDALFNQALQEVQSLQWSAAMQTLEALRNTDYTFRTLQVDGLYFTALRYRAVEMIIKEGNLEEGLYFLSVLARYAPLDHAAVNYSNVARLYLTGASFWDLDWEKVVFYFEQLYAALPGLYDGSQTATERYLTALEMYGDQLMSKKDPCGAVDYYQKGLNIKPLESLQAKYNKAYKECHPPTKVPTPTEEFIDITDEPVEIPTEVPPEVSPTP